jgi:hypothetical protein
MADPAVLGLIGTLSGTVIGFAGGLITQLVLERSKQEAEKKKKRAEKLEEFLSALWEQRALFSQSYGRQEAVKLISPTLATLDALTIIYFPELRPQLGTITKAGSKYLLALAGAIEGSDIEMAKNEYYNAISMLQTELIQYSKREFQ